MKREDRYIIIKRKDLKEAGIPEDLLAYLDLILKLEEYRSYREIGPLEAIVVEHDWPEYDKVLKLLKKPKSKQVVLPKEELLEIIIKQGYLPGEKYWTNQNPHMPYFYHSMFGNCGKEPDLLYEWDSSWLTSSNPLKSVPFLGDPRDLGLGTRVEKGHIPDSVIATLMNHEPNLAETTRDGSWIFVRGPVTYGNLKYRALYSVPYGTLKGANCNKAKIDFRNPVFTIEEE